MRFILDKQCNLHTFSDDKPRWAGTIMRNGQVASRLLPVAPFRVYAWVGALYGNFWQAVEA